MAKRKSAGASARGKRSRSPGASATRPKAELRVSRLDQVRVLADPLRLRMLQAFGEEPRTTKQVAELLGEKPTRLYHHVDAMVRAGLVSLHHTRQNRGAVEKYFTAVARRFEVGHELFASHGAAAEDESIAMIRALVEASHNDVLAYFGSDHCEPSVPPLVARAAIKAPMEDLSKFHDALRTLLTKAHKPAKAPRKKTSQYLLTIFFHPAPEESE